VRALDLAEPAGRTCGVAAQPPCRNLQAIVAYLETPDGVPLCYEDHGSGETMVLISLTAEKRASRRSPVRLR
jgi:hypothetical protein